MSALHTSRLFRSATKMPDMQEAFYKQYPVADTYNIYTGERGIARVDIDPLSLGSETYFNIIESCGEITHWRWRDPKYCSWESYNHIPLPERSDKPIQFFTFNLPTTK